MIVKIPFSDIKIGQHFELANRKYIKVNIPYIDAINLETGRERQVPDAFMCSVDMDIGDWGDMPLGTNLVFNPKGPIYRLVKSQVGIRFLVSTYDNTLYDTNHFDIKEARIHERNTRDSENVTRGGH